jgi:hypothetical protein
MRARRFAFLIVLFLTLGTGCEIHREVSKVRSIYRDLLKTCEKLLQPNSMAWPSGLDSDPRLMSLETERKELALKFSDESGTKFLKDQLSGTTDNLERVCIAKALFDIAANRRKQ